MKGILKIIIVAVPTTIITMVSSVVLISCYLDHVTAQELREHADE